MVILDTDHVSLLERPDHPPGTRLIARLSSLQTEEIATTIISYEEQTRGWMSVLAQAKSMANQVQAYRRLHQQLDNYCALRVFPFDERAAIEYQHLKQAKLRIGTMDLKIAAISLMHDATLLTRNLQDFIKVPGLKIQDWTKA
jgi:tRNA(fMet)-specific endonuclease VapC